MQGNLLRDSIGHALVRTFRQINRRFGVAASKLGVSAEQAHILLTLWGEGPMTAGALQRAVSLSAATLTGALQRLEDAGHVRRERAEDDRRAWRIEAVPWDARRRARLEATLLEVEAAYFSRLSPAERRQLRSLLVRVSDRPDDPP